MDQLNALTDAEARAERLPLPGTYRVQPEFTSKLIRELAAERDDFTRINDARQAIAEIRAKGDHPAFNEHSPNHKPGRAELDQLYKLAYPDQPSE